MRCSAPVPLLADAILQPNGEISGKVYSGTVIVEPKVAGKPCVCESVKLERELTALGMCRDRPRVAALIQHPACRSTAHLCARKLLVSREDRITRTKSLGYASSWFRLARAGGNHLQPSCRVCRERAIVAQYPYPPASHAGCKSSSLKGLTR